MTFNWPKKNISSWFIIAILLIAGYFIWNQEALAPTDSQQIEIQPTPTPAITAEGQDCIKKGGEWKTFGLRTKEECDLPTSDAGKTCTDSSQCESGCFTDHLGATSGKCGENTVIVGCGLIFVENGKTSGGALCAG